MDGHAHGALLHDAGLDGRDVARDVTAATVAHIALVALALDAGDRRERLRRSTITVTLGSSS